MQDVGVEFVYGTGESVAGQIITAELTVQNRNRIQDIYFYIIIKYKNKLPFIFSFTVTSCRFFLIKTT